MKKLFIIANWKSNKTTKDVTSWFEQFHVDTAKVTDKEIVVCSPSIALPTVKAFLDEKHLPIKLGSEDFSASEAGAHTGEEPPALVKEYVQYAIIGHSERRKELSETDDLLAKKVTNAVKYGVTPIFCVQGVDTPIPEGVSLVAYEPIFAIGTGTPDTPGNAESVIKAIKEKYPVQYVLYGGSVTADNVHTFTSMPSIDGVLVGGASLDPEIFAHLAENS